MKRFISSVFLLMLSLIAVWAEGTATMSLTNISLKPGDEVTLGIELTNPEDDITGVQCDLYLPRGISIKKDADGEFISQVTNRINTRKPHTLAWAWQSDGAMRLLNYSSTNQLYKGTNGAIIEVVLVADKNLLPGNYDINLKNIVISHPKGDVIKPSNYVGKATILPTEYTLTYILDDKEFYKETLSAGSGIIPKDVPAKEGYSFSGWKDLPSTMPTHDVTVTGSYIANSYMVRFVVDGKVIYEKSQAYGSKIVVPTVDEKEGYSFSGFGDVDETVPAHDVTYTGSYIANRYKVTFVADGKVVSEKEQEYGIPIVPPEAPSKEGHTFVGWGNVDKTVPAHDATYTAEYKVNSYKLTYEVDGVTYHSEEIAFGTAITPLAAPQKEGKTFSGWSEIPATMPAHDVKVTGSFSSNSYMVRFVVDGKVIYEKSQAYGSKIVVPTVDEKEGYTFSGFGDVDETVPAHDVTYTGSYIVNRYKVTFIADGKVVSEKEQEYGTPIVPPEAPSKEGHTFVGWGNVDKTVPAHDVTYTAEYKVNSYKLTYILNGNVFAEDSIAYGSIITPRELSDSDKSNFSGWEGLPDIMPAHDVVVYGTTTATGVSTVYNNNQIVTVYSVNGTVVKRNIDKSCLTKLLPTGVYVVSGKKILIK